MTKKKKKETKMENRISFRLTDQQYENLQVAAKRCRITPSEYVRLCLDSDEIVVIERFETKSEELEEITENYSTLGEIFNQLARFLNAGGEKTKQIEDEIHETIQRLLNLNKQTRQLLEEQYLSLGRDSEYAKEDSSEIQLRDREM